MRDIRQEIAIAFQQLLDKALVDGLQRNRLHARHDGAKTSGKSPEDEQSKDFRIKQSLAKLLIRDHQRRDVFFDDGFRRIILLTDQTGCCQCTGITGVHSVERNLASAR